MAKLAVQQCLFLFTALLFLLPPKSSSLTVEKKALLEFKSQLKDPTGRLASWTDSTSPCEFSGISCHPVTGRVLAISLDNVSISGELTPSLSTLKGLESLVITANKIHGRIPAEFGNGFENLRVLNLSFNRMVGKIPDLSRLKNLEALDLSSNLFSREFPSWVGNLSGLVTLGLGHNEFNEGLVPPELRNLRNLTWLFLAKCNFVGEFPEWVFELKELSTLDFSQNRLSGQLSRSISHLRKLTEIELFQNNLTGEIPRELANLTLLQEIDLSRNHFRGELPQELGNLKDLTVFQCSENDLSGEVPVGFGDLKQLNGLSLYRNSFSGEFPANLGRFAPLNSVDISENNFSGSFPSYLCESGNLRFLLALQNSFSGKFPSSYADCKSLVRFRVNKNQLSGDLPDGLWSLPNATIMDLSDNDFQAKISADIAGSVSLSELILTNNRFSGEIPSEIGNLRRLERLCLSNNSFSGEIPDEIGALKELSSLQLQYNFITGPIPPSLAQCSRLADLNLASNSLSGEIPATFSQMSSLNSLNLSTNKLTGPIPVSLGNLKLSLIDLSDNQLSGVIPSNLLDMGNDISFHGNKGLCADQNSKGHLNYGIGECHSTSSNKKSTSKRLALAFLVLTVMVIVLAALLILNYKSYKLHMKQIEDDIERENGIDSEWKIKFFHRLEFDSDDICNLGEENLIGTGGAGKVYRLELKKNGGTVAVKQLWKRDQFKGLPPEIEIMGKIRHRNILKLYACFFKEGRSFLVVEYMANGNLFQALHNKTKDGQLELDWLQRYKIALGVAKGLAYLHHDCSPPIIHRDIKSTNILLDENCEPKIADFGAAKASHSPKVSERSCLAGTHGYMAPEMGYSLKISVKSDVYSFGVVLLELLTSKNPIDEEFGEAMDIVTWVWSWLGSQRDGFDVLDKAVVLTEFKYSMVKVLKVATLCTAKVPSIRPTMRDVVKMLVDADPCTLSSSDKDSD